MAARVTCGGWWMVSVCAWFRRWPAYVKEMAHLQMWRHVRERNADSLRFATWTAEQFIPPPAALAALALPSASPSPSCDCECPAVRHQRTQFPPEGLVRPALPSAAAPGQRRPDAQVASGREQEQQHEGPSQPAARGEGGADPAGGAGRPVPIAVVERLDRRALGRGALRPPPVHLRTHRRLDRGLGRLGQSLEHAARGLRVQRQPVDPEADVGARGADGDALLRGGPQDRACAPAPPSVSSQQQTEVMVVGSKGNSSGL